MDNIFVHYKRSEPKSKNFLSVEDAIIEEIYLENMKNGYVLITYSEKDDEGVLQTEHLRLNVGPSTSIQTPYGETLSLYGLERGMHINALFSSAMTRSIPPQSQAYRITVIPDDDFIYITTDRVVEVDLKNGFLYTGNPNDISDQMRFVITDATTILNQNGDRVRLDKIRLGQMVSVEHATFQTPSIPPQTTAFRIYIR